MKEITIKCVDAFSNKSFAGNPAGIITRAEGLTDDVMQKIASAMIMNIVEYAFVDPIPSRNAAFRIRYFTPTKEIGISGHVTIAACYSLIEDGEIPLEDGVTTIHFDARVGTVPVEIYFHKDITKTPPRTDSGFLAAIDVKGKRVGLLQKIMMHQPLHTFSDAVVPAEEMAAVLGIEKREITGSGLPMVTASREFDWLLIPVRSKETLLGMNPDLIKLGRLNRRYGIQTNHVFTLDTFNSTCLAYSRHFGPAMGLWEDPATAVASGALGVYLLRQGVTSSRSMLLEQGKEADKLAKILVEIGQKDGAVTSLRVGGLAATSIVKKVRIDGTSVIEA